MLLLFVTISVTVLIVLSEVVEARLHGVDGVDELRVRGFELVLHRRKVSTDRTECGDELVEILCRLDLLHRVEADLIKVRASGLDHCGATFLELIDAALDATGYVAEPLFRCAHAPADAVGESAEPLAHALKA